MRPYLYALPLLALLPACSATPLCGDSLKCDSTTDVPGTTDATDSTSSTGAATEDPTGTSAGSESVTGDTSTTGDATTGDTTTGETSTTGETTGETTEAPPLLGVPSKHGEACAPDDGPAVELKIDIFERLCDSDWPDGGTQLRIVLFKPPAELGLGEHPLTGGFGFVFRDDGGDMQTGDTGVVVITEVTADGVRGTYDVTLGDNTQLSGAFDSLYCPVDAFCG